MSLTKRRKEKYFANYQMIGREMLLCQEWKQFSPSAKLLYIYLKSKHNGSNNGKIHLHYSELKTVEGLCSPSTVSRAFKVLEKAGWIKKTKLGGLYRYQNLYELTGKEDHHISDSQRKPREEYKKTTLPVASEYYIDPQTRTLKKMPPGADPVLSPLAVPEKIASHAGSDS